MNISPSPEFDAFVSRLTKSGRYATATEVVRSALRLLMEREDEREAKLDALRRDIQIGKEQLSRGETVSSDAFRARRDARRSHLLTDA